MEIDAAAAAASWWDRRELSPAVLESLPDTKSLEKFFGTIALFHLEEVPKHLF
jgi:hypothetical protein